MRMSLITDVIGRQILDSRGNPTVEVDVILEDGSFGRAAVPSGPAPVPMRLGNCGMATSRFTLEKGSPRPSRNINEELCERCLAFRLSTRSGSTTPCARSMARRTSSARSQRHSGLLARRSQSGPHFTNQPLYRYLGGAAARVLPAPMMNIINGGQHADNSVDVQEFMVMPLGFDNFSQALRCGVEIFHHLKKVLRTNGSTRLSVMKADSPRIWEQRRGPRPVMTAIEKAGYRPESRCKLPSTSRRPSFTTQTRAFTRSTARTSTRKAWLTSSPIGSQSTPLLDRRRLCGR